MCLYGEEERTLKSKRLEKRRRRLFFPGKSPVNCAPKPQLRKKEKKKSAPARKPSRERPSRPRLRTLPATNAREQNRIVQIRGPRSTFSLERWRQRDAKICGRRTREGLLSLSTERREEKKNYKIRPFFARTFRRRSRSWWVRSRRGHFYISRADKSADKSCSR